MLRALKRAKSDKVSISSFTVGNWTHMSLRSGLQLMVCRAEELPDIQQDLTAAGFGWDGRPEPEQADRWVLTAGGGGCVAVKVVLHSMAAF